MESAETDRGSGGNGEGESRVHGGSSASSARGVYISFGRGGYLHVQSGI